MSVQEDPDVWIQQVMQCKPLSEAEVKRLCEKVRGAECGVGCGV